MPPSPRGRADRPRRGERLSRQSDSRAQEGTSSGSSTMARASPTSCRSCGRHRPRSSTRSSPRSTPAAVRPGPPPPGSDASSGGTSMVSPSRRSRRASSTSSGSWPRVRPTQRSQTGWRCRWARRNGTSATSARSSAPRTGPRRSCAPRSLGWSETGPGRARIQPEDRVDAAPRETLLSVGSGVLALRPYSCRRGVAGERPASAHGAVRDPGRRPSRPTPGTCAGLRAAPTAARRGIRTDLRRCRPGGALRPPRTTPGRGPRACRRRAHSEPVSPNGGAPTMPTEVVPIVRRGDTE